VSDVVGLAFEQDHQFGAVALADYDLLGKGYSLLQFYCNVLDTFLCDIFEEIKIL
jgi:hypothetical protein